MADYSVRVKSKSGAVEVITVTASSENSAKIQAKSFGTVLSVSKSFSLFGEKPLSAEDRHILLMRLSVMLRSKVGTSESLQLLRDTFGGSISFVAAKLYNLVSAGGKSLPEAIEEIGAPHFPQTTVALIKAGCQTGSASDALDAARDFEHQLHEVQRSAGRQIFSALAGFIFAGLTVIGTTLILAPMLQEIDFFQQTKHMTNTAWVDTFGMVMGWLMAFIMSLLFILFLLAKVGRLVMPVQADKIIMMIPYYKDLILARNNFVTLWGLGLLIQSGVPAKIALSLAAENAPKGALREDILNASASVGRGELWPVVMKTLHPTDRAALLSATDKEQTSQTLLGLADQYKKLYAQRLASIIPMITILAAIFLALSGFLVFMQGIMPMLQISAGILDSGGI